MNPQKIINDIIGKNMLQCSECNINYTSKLEKPHFPYKYKGLSVGKQIKYSNSKLCPKCGGKPKK